MNNYYTLLTLCTEINKTLVNSKFIEAVCPRKNQLELYVHQGERQLRLIASTSFGQTALFLDEYKPTKSKNVLRFFRHLESFTIMGLRLIPNERWVSIDLQDEQSIKIKLFGNGANVMHVGHDGIIVEAFKEPSRWEGKLWSVQEHSTEKERSPKKSARETILHLDPKLPRGLSADLVTFNSLDAMPFDQLSNWVQHLVDQMKLRPQPRQLEDGRFTIINNAFLPLKNKKEYDSVNEGIRDTFFNGMRLTSLAKALDELKQQLGAGIKKAHARLAQLSSAEKTESRAQRYEQYGHLIMANVHRSIEADELISENMFEPGITVRIPLDKTLSLQQNAQRYYQKAKDARAERVHHEKLRKRSQEQVQALLEAEKALAEVHQFKTLEQWKSRYAQLLWFHQQAQSHTQIKPYRVLHIQDYEVWVGKSAQSNDQLVRDAHKEDIWMHARSVSGSHVLIRMRGNHGHPEKNVLELAASIAAFHSKNAGSSLVPVQYTKRKFVRKPKGTEPGAVLVEKEMVLMVEPKKWTEDEV